MEYFEYTFPSKKGETACQTDMPKIIISINNKKLRNFLNGNRDNFTVLKADSKDSNTQQFLSEHNTIDIYDIPQASRDDFVQSYLSLIEELSLMNNDKYWWAYSTSSKNRHMSKLFDHLYIFVLITNVIEKVKERNIIILNPPNSIIKPLARYLDHKKRETRIIGRIGFPDYHEALFVNINFFVNTAIRIYYITFRIILSKILLLHKYNRLISENKRWFVFRSWFNNQSFPKGGAYHDSFFGELCQYLKERNRPVLLIVGMFGVKFRNAIFAIAKIKDYSVFPVEFFLKWSDLLKAMIDALKSKVVLKRSIHFKNNLDISDIIQYHLNIDFSNTLFLNILYFYISKNLANNILIERIFLTSENNCWEKMCIQAIRDFSRLTKIIGFPHAIVSPAKLSMILSEYEKEKMPLPDTLVTNGEITKDLLINTGKYDTSMIKAGCALKYKKILDLKLKTRKISNERTFLAAFEGVNESAELINFIYDCFKESSAHKVIIRPHPALPIIKIRQYLRFHPDRLPKNFSISISKERSLIDDLSIADFLLYNGSTVSIEALAMGIPVIYIDLKKAVCSDPLFSCNYLKKIASTKTELQFAIDFFNTMDSGEFTKQQRLANDYTRRYFYPVNEKNLQVFLQ
ncbi:MAG: hypothetical protein WC321_00210 [Candidatus Omnitrophota bacterium]